MKTTRTTNPPFLSLLRFLLLCGLQNNPRLILSNRQQILTTNTELLATRNPNIQFFVNRTSVSFQFSLLYVCLSTLLSCTDKCPWPYLQSTFKVSCVLKKVYASRGKKKKAKSSFFEKAGLSLKSGATVCCRLQVCSVFKPT